MRGGKKLAVRRRAAGRVGRGGKEGERAEESDGRIQERNNIGPSDVGIRIRSGGGSEQNSLVVVDNTIGGGGKAVPESPVSAGGVGARGIVGMFCKEVAIVAASDRGGSGSGIKKGAFQVNLDEEPTRAHSAGGAVGNEE